MDKAPFILLKQSETMHGQYDLNIEAPWTYLNYTIFKQILSNITFKGDISKRVTQRQIFNGSSTEWDQIYYWNTQCSQILSQTPNECSNNPYCLPIPTALYFIDFEKEKSLGIGSHWPIDLFPKTGEALASSQTLKLNNINIGDTLLFQINMDRVHYYTVTNFGANYDINDLESCGDIFEYNDFSNCQYRFPAKIIGAYDDKGFGKWGLNDDSPNFVMSPHNFTEYIWNYGNDNIQSCQIIKDNMEETFTNIVQNMLFSMPNRLNVYSTLNFDKINYVVSEFASLIVYYVGYRTIYAYSGTIH